MNAHKRTHTMARNELWHLLTRTLPHPFTPSVKCVIWLFASKTHSTRWDNAKIAERLNYSQPTIAQAITKLRRLRIIHEGKGIEERTFDAETAIELLHWALNTRTMQFDLAEMRQFERATGIAESVDKEFDALRGPRRYTRRTTARKRPNRLRQSRRDRARPRRR